MPGGDEVDLYTGNRSEEVCCGCCCCWVPPDDGVGWLLLKVDWGTVEGVGVPLGELEL